MSLDLFQVLPPTFIQESLATRKYYENLDSLYALDNEVRVSIMDLLRLNKLFTFFIYSFGYSDYGQLSDGNPEPHTVKRPTQINTSIFDTKSVKQIEAGEQYSLFLCNDGSVYSCGRNDYGSLGNGVIGGKNVATPTPIDKSLINDRKVVQISTRNFHSLLLCEDGSVFSFGSNRFGQLGLGDRYILSTGIPSPIDMSMMRGKKVIQVSAGGFHSLLLCDDGSVYSCGNGELAGVGPVEYIDDYNVHQTEISEYDIITPSQIDTSLMDGKKVIEVSAGEHHSLLLCEDGTVYSFGSLSVGQLGNGVVGDVDDDPDGFNFVGTPSPINTVNMVDIEGKVKGVIRLFACYGTSFLICEDYSVYSFGHNYYGKLGNGDINKKIVTIPSPIDTSLMEGKQVIKIASNKFHTLFLCGDGSVYSCGHDEYGVLGDEHRSARTEATPSPIDTSLMEEQKVIYIAADHKLMLNANINNSLTLKKMPLDLFEVLPATFIQESLATRKRYKNLEFLYGLNNEVRIALLDLIKLRKLKLFYGIVYAFGANDLGELGVGNTDHVATPTPIDTTNIGSKRVIQVSAGVADSLFLCEDGTVFSVGDGENGGLGDGNIDDHNEVVPIPIDSSKIIDINGNKKKVIQVSAGSDLSLLLSEDGIVYSWGDGSDGKLGDGNILYHPIGTPTPVDRTFIGEKRVIQISAGEWHSLLLCEDDTVYSFGDGKYGQLGNGQSGITSKIGTPSPIDSTMMKGRKVIQVAAGDKNSIILCEDGTVYSFGLNKHGKLGIGDTNNVSIPTQINTTNIGEKKVIQVAAGDDHSLLLCEDGTVYAFGYNFYGQLGTGNTDSVSIPTEIDTSKMEGKKVIQVSAGSSHSLLLCEDGSVYSCGYNGDGQLGNRTLGNVYIIVRPSPIDTSLMTDIDGEVKRVIQIATSIFYSFLLT